MTSSEFIKLLGSKIHINIGYIIVPPDVDRGAFIANCYSNEEVSMYPETGGISYNRVKITPDSLQNIEFPEEGEDFGSMVLYFLHPVQRYPIIFGTLDKKNECKLLQWKQFKFLKSYKGSEVSVLGDAVRSSLKIKVKGTGAKNSSFLIEVLDSENKGSLVLNVQGDIKLLCSTLSILNRDLEVITKNSVKLVSNAIQIRTLNFSVDCVEERTDKFKEELPEDSDVEVGLVTLKAKSLDMVIGSTIIHIEDSGDDDNSEPLISINNGEKGGLINISDLTDKLNNLVSEVNSLVDKFNNHKHGGLAGDKPINTVSSSGESADKISEFDKNNYEDTTIIH